MQDKKGIADIFTICEGNTFNRYRLFHLYFFIIFIGVLLCLDLSKSTFIGIPLIFIGASGLTFNYGTQVNFTENKIRGYSSYWGIKFGDWVPMDDYSHIILLPTRQIEKEEDAPYFAWSAYDFTDIGIYLLNLSNGKRTLVENHNSRVTAIPKAKFYSKKLGKEFIEHE